MLFIVSVVSQRARVPTFFDDRHCRRRRRRRCEITSSDCSFAGPAASLRNAYSADEEKDEAEDEDRDTGTKRRPRETAAEEVEERREARARGMGKKGKDGD